MNARGLLSHLTAGLAATAICAGAAHAQSDADRRFDRLEKSVRTLQSAVSQAQATGAPVVVRPEGPDPAVLALQSRMDELEQSRRSLTGQVETLTNQLEQTSRAREAERAAANADLKAMADRTARLEAQLAAMTAPPAPVGPDIGLGGPAPDRPLRGGVEPQDGGQVAEQTEASSFRRARDLKAAGDYDMAAASFQDYLARYGTSPRAPEAYYNLGDIYYLRENYRDATAAYASALKARPKTAWAPDAMVRLAESLNLSGQAPQACAAAAEFTQRYAATASAAVKKRATAVRTRAKCG
ncbi:MAG: tetratricopeptide repeat protein [Caulobacteraceae bacterium]